MEEATNRSGLFRLRESHHACIQWLLCQRAGASPDYRNHASKCSVRYFHHFHSIYIVRRCLVRGQVDGI